jgi:hypothetical protein
MFTLKDIAWPVLRVGTPNCTALRYEDGTDFERITLASIARVRRMKEYLLLDSRGEVYELCEVHPAHRIGVLNGIFLRLLDKRVRVEWALRRREGGGVTVAKEILVKNIRENAEFWAETEEPEKLIKRVCQCKNMDELISLF